MSPFRSPMALRWPAFIAVILSSAQAALLNWLTADQVAPGWWAAWVLLVLLIGGMAMGAEAQAPRTGRGALLLTPLVLGFSIFVLGNIGLLGAVLQDEESALVDVFMWALAIVSTFLAGVVGALVGLILGEIRVGLRLQPHPDPRKIVAAIIAGVTMGLAMLVYQTILNYDPSVASASRIALEECQTNQEDARRRVDEAFARLQAERSGASGSGVPGEGSVYRALLAQFEAAQQRLSAIQGECDALAAQDRAEVDRFSGAKRNNHGSRLPLGEISLMVMGLDVVVCLLVFAYHSPRADTVEREVVDDEIPQQGSTVASRTAPQRSEERTAGAAPAEPAP